MKRSGLVLLLQSCILAACTSAPAQGDQMKVAPRAPALNHVYVVLDAPTFAAVRDDASLSRLLGRADGGLPAYALPTTDAERIFFRGRTTYLELFSPDNRFGEPVGKVGVALGYDTRQDFDRLADVWAWECGDTFRMTPVAWQRTQPPIPWYDALQCDGTASGPVAVWAMVYRPDFHRWQSGSTAGAPTVTARAGVLAPRAAAGQGRFDLVGLSVTVPPQLRQELVSQLTAAGMSVSREGEALRLSGDGWHVTMHDAGPEQRRSPLDAIYVEVSDALDSPLHLGGTTLVSDGTLSRWQFSRKAVQEQ